MSSLRNAVKRITHKERAQPKARSHLGLLEKKKDYVKRAKDFHRKEDTINRLKQKASMRNPDEFYFGMNKAEIKDGKHQKTRQAKQEDFDEAIGNDTIRIMKDQDLSYVRMQRAKDQKKIEKLQASLHLGGGAAASGSERKHTIFVDSKQEVADFDAAKHFDTLPELVGRSFNRTKVDQVKQMAYESLGCSSTADRKGNETDSDVDDSHVPKHKQLSPEELKRQAFLAKRSARKLARAKRSAYREIEERSKRAAKMAKAEAHLMTEKLLAAKGTKRKIKGAQDGMPAQFLWRKKRLK
eukprot:CAMPEP_0172475672 /NCGR_PEP_ID=MMETSP1065-20121228/69989_1 /TAXON_ID=265537 /ORGANISM="Amphiprora paludosa, Strain CCMP125" /LENGTH=296 /DNA_ID=CAMNT_0013233885 /DNA_START=78 /DNA_END=968 /DNA_ORIENTATION=+